MGHEVPLERVSPGVSHSWNEGCPRVPKSLGHPKSCWAGGSTEMPPEMSPPLPPNSCWLNAAGLLPLNQLPARLAPAHQDAGSPALRSSCPPAPSAPCQLWALGGGGSPSAVEPARQAQAPPSYRESPRPCSQAVASRGSTWASQAQSEAGSWGPPGEQLLPAPRAEVGARSPSGPRHWPARIPPAQGFARAPESP